MAFLSFAGMRRTRTDIPARSIFDNIEATALGGGFAWRGGFR
jgi:hypothetical protein